MMFLAYVTVSGAALFAVASLWDYLHYDEPWSQTRALVRRGAKWLREW